MKLINYSGKILYNNIIPIHNVTVKIYQNDVLIREIITEEDGEFNLMLFPNQVFTLIIERNRFETKKIILNSNDIQSVKLGKNGHQISLSKAQSHEIYKF